MVRTIGNPLSWTARAVEATGAEIVGATARIGGDAAVRPEPATLHYRDLREALRAGWDDMAACRADALTLAVIYPAIGIVLIGVGFHLALVPLIVPLISGFALLGPVAALPLYEISRRREAGQSAGWADALGVLRAPSLAAILVLALYLVAIFVIWMVLAAKIYGATLGPEPPVSLAAFATDVLTTRAGWEMAIAGTLAGGVLALAVLAVSVVSFPLLLDRPVGLPVAVVTSVRVARRNPGVVLAWGGIVAAGLVLGSIPFLLGLVVVLPVLGHATWHLYRRAVV